LLIAPVKGYGRGLMSVTGHLFGAHKFDDLYTMFKYVLNISLTTTLAVMIVFIFLRNYAFSLFSITGMESEVFHIAIGGTIIMMAIPFSMISSKMLDGFGKSMYSLMFTFLKIMFEMVLIYELSIVMSSGMCVLIGITVSEIIFAIVYYLFLRHMFMNFDEVYEDKATVRNFNNGDEDNEKSLLEEIKQINGKSKATSYSQYANDTVLMSESRGFMYPLI
jgi:Na+-driven multidrug efflux pump